jgi:probable rRNA maturation factor
LRADALALLKILALQRCELSLLLLGDSGIRRLNREFRGKDKATDVLSFPQLEPAYEPRQAVVAAASDAPPLALGDIVISIDTARRQARELGQHISNRIRMLLIHGMLHLLGYDHERSIAEARRMFAREHELAALMEAKGRPSRSRLKEEPWMADAAVSSRANQTRDLGSSPAAMPVRVPKAVKKSRVARRPS